MVKKDKDRCYAEDIDPETALAPLPQEDILEELPGPKADN